MLFGRKKRDRRLKDVSFPLKQGQVSLGHGSYINRAVIYAWHEKQTLTVGCYCSIADDVVFLLGGEHDLHSVTTWPWHEKLVEESGVVNYSRGGIVLEHDVWIGHGALLLSGTRVGTGAVIGAGAVVRGDIPPYAIVVGNPGRIIRYRFDQPTRACLLESRWWTLPPEQLEQYVDVLGDVSRFCEVFKKRQSG